MKFIFHLDMDCFFAAIEIKNNPSKQNLPVIVCSKTFSVTTPIHGVVSSVSYNARKYGIISSMPLSKAFKLCPNLVYFPLNLEYYKIISINIFNILLTHSTKIEKKSIDEAYFEIDYINSYEEAKIAAQKIKDEIYKHEKLTCSIGISVYKIVSKIASNINKPNSITIIKKENIFSFLFSLNVSSIPGIGIITNKKLCQLDIHTVFDLYNTKLETLTNNFGKRGIYLYNLIHNIEKDNILVTNKNQKSICRYITINKKLISNKKFYFDHISTIINELYNYLIKNNIFFRTITIHIRDYKNNFSISKSKSNSFYSCNIDMINNIVLNSFFDIQFIKNITQIGICVSNLKKKNMNQTTLSKFIS